MDAASNNEAMDSSFSLKLTGLDILFGLGRSEWVALYKDTVDVDRLCSTLHVVAEQFPLLKGRLVRRGKHLFVEHLEAGIEIEMFESDEPAPAMGPDKFPLLATGLVPEMPPVPLEEHEQRPLAAVRIIRYKDGRVTVGTSLCHGIVDGGSMNMFFAACRQAYFDEALPSRVEDRAIVLKLVAPDVATPTTSSGLMLKPFDPQLFAKPPQPCQFFGIILPEAEHLRLAERIKERFGGGLSFNNYLQAILMRAFAKSSQEEGRATTHANMSYDLRRLGPGFVPLNYFGGATIFRSLSATFDELREGALADIAQRFKRLGRPSEAEVRQDIGYIQKQYEAGNINDFGAFDSFLTPLLNGGLYINNFLAQGRPSRNPASNILWTEMPLRMPFVIRMAMLHINASGDISIRMALPVEQHDAFREQWSAILAQELSA